VAEERPTGSNGIIGYVATGITKEKLWDLYYETCCLKNEYSRREKKE
jgi:hypothetical protein